MWIFNYEVYMTSNNGTTKNISTAIDNKDYLVLELIMVY